MTNRRSSTTSSPTSTVDDVTQTRLRSTVDNVTQTRLPSIRSHSTTFSWTSVVVGAAVVMFVVFSGLVKHSDAIEWLAVAKKRDDSWNRTSSCRTEGITRPQQRRLCTRNLEFISAIARSSRQAAQVCQELFYDSHWNCSSVLLAPKFMPDLNGGSREQAVMHALASASLTYFIAKHCSSGNAIKCSCGRTPTTEPPNVPGVEHRWGGCCDDVKFALSFAQSFTNAGYGGKVNTTSKISKQTAMNQHNDLVGRKAMADTLKTTCKCHGVSGSCSVKTCWKSLVDLKVVGATILESYSNAVEVEYKRVPSSGARVDLGEAGVRQGSAVGTKKGSQKKLVPVHSSKSTYTAEELIYYTLSPDYCMPEASAGSVGTKGRECRKDDTGSAGCQSMCCGRGYTSEMVEVQKRCECKYVWCCYVKCKVCVENVEVSRCR